jgi:hypothetical protein
MVEDRENVILQEYELLIGANLARTRGDQESYESFLNDIQKDLNEEYIGNLDEKIDRWLDVTRIMHFRNERPVELYMQAKLLYRDGFYEAAIMFSRSTAEFICYYILQDLEHPFGTPEEIEKQNFRKLVKYIFEDAHYIDERIYALLNSIYDIGNNYVHPKANKQAKQDARVCMMLLGESIDRLYGVRSFTVDSHLKNAYDVFPDICRGLHFGIVAFKTPEAAEKDARRWGYEVGEGHAQQGVQWTGGILRRLQAIFKPQRNSDSK